MKTKKRSALWQGRFASNWDFWEHGVSPSAMQMFVTCREQFRLRYVEGWKSRRSHLGTEFGECFHFILEKAYAMKKPPSMAIIDRWLDDYEKAWFKRNTMATTYQVDMLRTTLVLARATAPGYFRRYVGDWGTGKYPIPTKIVPKKWLGLETWFEIPYEFEDGRRTKIRGRRDGVFETASKKLMVFDTKCLSMINESDLLEALPVNLQQMAYVWATWRETGRYPSGAVLNVVRRSGMKMSETESLSDFEQRVREEVENPKRWSHFFMRPAVDTLTTKEILDWQNRQLVPLMNELRGWWEGTIPHYPNPEALITKYGRSDYFEVITSGNYGLCFRDREPTMRD